MMRYKDHLRKSLVALAALLTTSTAAAAPRDTVNINFGWQFGRDRQATNETVDLPHDFQIGQPWIAPAADERPDNRDAGANVRSRLSSRGFKEMGDGWYRYSLTPREEWKDRRVVIDFGGIIYVGEVYLNGEQVGKTDYGYVGFEIDITNRLKWGQANLIEVHADTQQPNNSRWYTGGGLFRDVNIIITNANRYFGRHPLYITTKNNRDVSISAEIICNDRTEELNVGIRILDAKGKAVAEKSHRLAFNRRWKQREYELPTLTVADATAWDTDNPYLYTAELTLYDDHGNAIDQTTERFGFRTIEFSPEFGLKLNGRKVLLKGAANHHTLGALGAAAYPRAIEKRIELLKSFGYNHIRTSHNPYSTDLLRLCDEKGVLVVDELYDKWNKQYTGGRADFAERWQQDIPEFIRRDRNHPCVVLWSLGNELQQNADMLFNDWGVTLYRLQRQLLLRYDSTRLVTVAMHPRYRSLDTDSIPAPLALATDVASYNYRYMYFPGDAKRYPWMMFYQSEASTADMGPNFFSPDNNKVIGLAYWGPIDYLGESGGWPAKGWAQGAFDISLQPKPIAWLVKSMFTEEPVVHIGIIEQLAPDNPWNGINVGTAHMSENWNRERGSKVSLYTYTNADEVELFVNGRSQGVKRNTDNPRGRNKLKWDDIAYEEGTIEAVARKDGKEVARHRLETTGEAVALRLEPDNTHWKADGMDLQHVRITAVDRKGRRVYAANDQLTFTVAGDARIVGVDNGDITSEELHTGNTRRLFNGSALVILRSGRQPSKVTLSVKGGAFKEKRLSLRSI